MSANIVFLLRADAYNNVDDSSIGKITAETLFWQLIAQMMCSIFVGYAYDLAGRRITVICSFILIILALVWTPYTMPRVLDLCLARVILGIGVQA